MRFMEQIRYRAKAIIAALGAAVVGLLAWLLTSPDLARTLAEVVPAPWAALVPVVLAYIATTYLVNRVPNRTPTALTRSDDDDEQFEEPSLDTQHLAALTTGDDGFESGNGR